MEQLQHFTHEHLLSLIRLQPNRNNENSDNEDEDEDKDEDDFVMENHHIGKCQMCKEEIHSFHLCYYCCKDCDYSLHKFCAQLSITQQNHPLHPGHNLTLSQEFQLHDPGFKFPYTPSSVWKCVICKVYRKMFYNYHCSICKFDMDIVCATMSEQKIDHPSHPHQLQRYFSTMASLCHACGKEHSGNFYYCTICPWFRIHFDCALLPAKLLIQQSTKGSFSHPHSLTLVYSFPYIEKRDRFFPHCRICDTGFNTYEWHYRCDKCRYYVHVKCITSKGLGRTYKHLTYGAHPNLIRCPFPDESDNLLKYHFINKGDIVLKGVIDGDMFSHPHPLILIDTFLNGSVSLHDPMKKVELFCNGCVRPITDVPFYKCSQHHCDFVLHEWCTRLPSEIQPHHDHLKHMLVFLPKVPGNLLGVFKCEICGLHSNGFVYGCIQCKYYVDINCGFIPPVITHEADPDHLLLRYKSSGHQKGRACKACKCYIGKRLGFSCRECDFHLHTECALLLPRTIRHRYDKHPLSLKYYPVENHISEYFCDICEDEFNPAKWFYHCEMCASSMHTACAPLKLQCEHSTVSEYNNPVSLFYNVKFGGTHEVIDHPHPLTFLQGINTDGQCIDCHEPLQYNMILKCFRCKFACHLWCVRKNHVIRDA